MSDPERLVWNAILAMSQSLPYWVPVVFLAYAIGRKKFGLRLLFLLLTVEAVSIMVAYWSLWWIAMAFNE